MWSDLTLGSLFKVNKRVAILKSLYFAFIIGHRGLE